MIIDESKILRHVNEVTGVLHIGAHEAQELDFYRKSFGQDFDIYWVEADPKIIRRLKIATKSDPRSYVVNACVADEYGRKMTFHRANMDQSSSLLDLKTHADVHPEVSFVDEFTVTTTTLDQLDYEWDFAWCNFLNMDVQGAEGLVIQGGDRFLSRVDYIYTEVNRDELYAGCILIDEMDNELGKRGFIRKEVKIYDHLGWGDALYVRFRDGKV